jgi:hypothetical protein
MKLDKWIRLLFICLIVAMVVLVIVPPAALAGGSDHHNDDTTVNVDSDVNLDTNVNVTGGDTNVPVDVSVVGGDSPVSVNHSSKAFALSNGLGDVDIAGCLGSTQWATPLFSKQKLVVNWPCLAEFYLEHGKYELAAMAICNTEIVKEFDDEAACEAAHDFAPLAAPEPIGLLQEFDTEQTIQDDRIDFVQASQMEVMARLDHLEERVERAPAPRPTRVIEQKVEPAFTPEQKALAWAALTGGGDEEDE